MGSSLKANPVCLSPLLPDLLLLVTLAVLTALPVCLERLRDKEGMRLPKALEGVLRGEVDELMSPAPLSTDCATGQSLMLNGWKPQRTIYYLKFCRQQKALSIIGPETGVE